MTDGPLTLSPSDLDVVTETKGFSGNRVATGAWHTPALTVASIAPAAARVTNLYMEPSLRGNFRSAISRQPETGGWQPSPSRRTWSPAARSSAQYPQYPQRNLTRLLQL